MEGEIPIHGDLEVLKNGDFATRVEWMHREFSEDVAGMFQSERALLYFWAVSMLIFEAWLFKTSGRPTIYSNILDEISGMIRAVWNSSAFDSVIKDASMQADNMRLCWQRFSHSEEEMRFVEEFSHDENPRDFRSAICRVLKRWDVERNLPDTKTRVTTETVCV